MAIRYDYIEEILPKDIFFITTQELEDLYPGLYSSKEQRIPDHKGQGRCLPHADRRQDLPQESPTMAAPRTTMTGSLNGDILVYYPVSGHCPGAVLHGHPCG